MFTTPIIASRSFSTYVAGFLLMPCATLATAHEQQDLCYPLAHGEDGLGSSNFKYINHLEFGSTWHTNVYVTNVSHKSINIKMPFKNNRYEAHSFQSVVYYDFFNEENSPLNLETGGAILRPGETGLVVLRNSSYPGTVTGKVIWQADACLKHAITASVRNIHVTSSRFSQGLFPLNNGDPF